jgi:hypothetical protein
MASFDASEIAALQNLGVVSPSAKTPLFRVAASSRPMTVSGHLENALTE